MVMELYKATLETIYMTFMSTFIAIVTGIPLGIYIYMLSLNNSRISKTIYKIRCSYYRWNTFKSDFAKNEGSIVCLHKKT